MRPAGRPAVAEQTRVLLAGAAVSIAASSPSLGAIVTRPLAHLPRARGAADLLVEARSGGQDVSPGPHRIDLADRGAVVTYVHPSGRAVLDRRDGVLRVWWPTEAAVPPEDRTKPFLLCLSLWLADRGLAVAHAGCIARDGRAVLLVGASGSGKSTASLACAARGFTFLGDDQVAVGIEHDRPTVHSLYSTARLDAEHLAANPALGCGGAVLETGEPKPLLLLSESAARLVPSARVAAVAVVRHGPDGIRPISRAAALRALAPSSLARMPLGPPAFELFAEVTSAVPAAVVQASTPDAFPELLGRVLEEV